MHGQQYIKIYIKVNTVIFGSNFLAIIDMKKGIKQFTMEESFKCHLTRPLRELEDYFPDTLFSSSVYGSGQGLFLGTFKFFIPN